MKTALFALIALTFLLPAAAYGADAGAPDSDSESRARLDQFKALISEERHAEAESLASAMTAHLETAAHPDTLVLAEFLVRLALISARTGSRTDEECYELAVKSLSLLDARHDAPDTLVYLAHRQAGVNLTNLERPHEAKRHDHAALEIARRRTDWGTGPVSLMLFFMGRVMADMGQSDSALVVLNESLALRLELRLPRDTLIGRIYSALGRTYAQMGRSDLADEAFASGIRSIEEQEGPDSAALAYALTDAAEFAFVRGDYARAIDYDQRGFEVLSKATPTAANLLIVEASLAEAMLALGDAEGARAHFERATPQLEAAFGAEYPQVLNCWLVLGDAHYQLGDSLRALALYRKVGDVLEADSSKSHDVLLANALVNQAQILSRIAPSDSALELARRVERINGWDRTQQASFTLSALAVQLSILARRGEWDEVERIDAAIDEGLNRLALAANTDADIAWKARSDAAALHGRHEEAVRLAVAGSRCARERLVQNVRALSDRQGLLFASVSSEPLDQLLRLGANSDPASIRLAWDEVIRTRGVVRAEIARRRRPLGTDGDVSLALAHAAWVADQARLAQFDASLGTAYRDAATDSTRRALRTKADDSERRLVRSFPSSKIPGDPSLVGLDSVLARLDADDALVGFVRAPGASGEQRVVAFVALGDSHGIESIDVGDADSLESLVAEWSAELGNTDPRGRSESVCRALGARVRARVWDPIAAAIGSASDLYVVPEAPLCGLSWGALPTDSGRYLVESRPTVHVLDAERELVPETTEQRGVGLLALGAIDYDGAGQDTAAREVRIASLFRGISSECDDAAARHLAPLPATEDEVRDVAAAWSRGPESFGSSTRLENDHATETDFKRLAPGCQVLHIATHGVMLSDTCGGAVDGLRGVGGVEPVAARTSPSGAPKHDAGTRPPARPATERKIGAAVSRRASPWLGRQVFLALAGANHARDGASDENEGLLTAEEVTTLDLRGVDWVVLSACHSAAGEAWSGQGVLGMQRAFHLAGARTVVASQWSVEDESTREWMRALYEARSDGALRAADAMAAASRTVLDARRESGRSTHPFFWGAFTASGE